ncbi:MAG: response regulator [bacterium]|nr:response regulator [bacterium]
MKEQRPKSFLNKLTLLMLLAVGLPLLSSSLLFVGILGRRLEDSFEQRLTADLEIISLIFNSRERELLRGVSRLSADNTLQVTLNHNVVSQLNRYLDHHRETMGLSGLAVYDPDGRLIGGSGIDVPYLGEKSLSVIKSGTVELVGAGQIVRDNESLGLLVASLDLMTDDFIRYLDNKLVDDVILWLDDTLCGTTVSHVPANTDLKHPSQDQAREYVIAGEKYLMRVASREIDNHIITWGVCIPLQIRLDAQRSAILLVVAIELGIFAFIMILFRRFIRGLSSPLVLLTQAADNMCSGKSIPDLDDVRNDELGRLSASFKTLMRSVANRRLEYMQLEKGLRGKLTEHRNLLDAIPDTIALVGSDGRYRDVNKAFETMVGTSRDRIIGKLDMDLVLLMNADEVHERDMQVIESGESSHCDEWVCTLDGVRTQSPCLRIPFSDSAGNVEGLVRINRNCIYGESAADTSSIDDAIPEPLNSKRETSGQGKSLEDQKGDGQIILLVDDDSVSRDLISFYLGNQGFRIRSVCDGLEAVETVADQMGPLGEPPALILMDMQMPRMNGDKALGKIREAGYGEPIIVLTGSASNGDTDEFLAMGFTDVVAKPVDLSDLVPLIIRHLELAKIKG